MKLTKKQIIDGLYQFITDEVVPTMNGDKLTQFVLITAINFVKANSKLVDSIFAKLNEMTVSQMRKFAKEKDIDISGLTKRDEILPAIADAILTRG